jgi:hypothetical protein
MLFCKYVANLIPFNQQWRSSLLPCAPSHCFPSSTIANASLTDGNGIFVGTLVLMEISWSCASCIFPYFIIVVIIIVLVYSFCSSSNSFSIALGAVSDVDMFAATNGCQCSPTPSTTAITSIISWVSAFNGVATRLKTTR